MGACPNHRDEAWSQARTKQCDSADRAGASGGEAKGRAERVPVPESVQTSGQRKTACTGSFNNGNGDCGSVRGVLLAERVTMRMVLDAQDAPCVLVKRGDRKAREVCISAALAGLESGGL